MSVDDKAPRRNGRYLNPGLPPKSPAEVLRWALTRRPARWPERIPVATVADLGAPPREGHAAATFIGHSSFLLRFATTSLLIDPVWSERASPVSWAGPRRVRGPALEFGALPSIDAILLTHDHYDHLDLPTVRRLVREHRSRVVTTAGNAAWLARRGVPGAVELDWWDDTDLGDGRRAVLVPARHFSGRTPWGRDRTLWGGFVVEGRGLRLYHASDSGYGDHFRRIRERLGPLDLAMLPIGAYEPRWFMRSHHIDPDEAVRAHLDLGGPPTVAMHFGTFQLTDEAIDEPERRLRAALARLGIPDSRFRVPGFGETIEVAPRAGTQSPNPASAEAGSS